MKRTLIAAALAVALALVASAQQSRPTGQPGAVTGQTEKLQSEVRISTLPTADLTKQITAVSQISASAKATADPAEALPREGGPDP